ncbi:MAG: hypothetical protein QOJ45_21 [Verrucomicrobiota bacterium]
MHNDVGRLCLLLGHTSPTMLWKHYYKAVTKKRAIAFWLIEPPAVDSGVSEKEVAELAA